MATGCKKRAGKTAQMDSVQRSTSRHLTEFRSREKAQFCRSWMKQCRRWFQPSRSEPQFVYTETERTEKRFAIILQGTPFVQRSPVELGCFSDFLHVLVFSSGRPAIAFISCATDSNTLLVFRHKIFVFRDGYGRYQSVGDQWSRASF